MKHIWRLRGNASPWSSLHTTLYQKQLLLMCKDREFRKIQAPQCSWQHYLYFPRYGNNLSTDEWIKKMLYIYTVEYYSAMWKNEIMPFATTCLGLEGIMLSEISQTQKGKYYTISVICGSKNTINQWIKKMKTESQRTN